MSVPVTSPPRPVGVWVAEALLLFFVSAYAIGYLRTWLLALRRGMHVLHLGWLAFTSLVLLLGILALAGVHRRTGAARWLAATVLVGLCVYQVRATLLHGGEVPVGGIAYDSDVQRAAAVRLGYLLGGAYAASAMWLVLSSRSLAYFQPFRGREPREPNQRVKLTARPLRSQTCHHRRRAAAYPQR